MYFPDLYLWCISVFIFISAPILGQEKSVRLIEEVQKKRTILYVQNDTESEKSVFLKIHPIGYRKSAEKPIIKNIPAKSRIQMTVLIPLTDTESVYTYDLIVNEELKNVQAKRSPKKN